MSSVLKARGGLIFSRKSERVLLTQLGPDGEEVKAVRVDVVLESLLQDGSS